jgi:sterol desaturase/sphingolipid hydroxylase (fatty acid hydroxylase superfamily)
MIVFHAVGFGFELSDRKGWLRNAKTRDVGRKPYRELLPRILANQVFVLLPAMIAVQWAGLAFTGAASLSPCRFVANMILLGIGHDVVQYIAHRYLLHRREFGHLVKHGLHHSTGASQAVSACYMSTADFFLEIVLPYLIPLVLIGGGGADIVFHPVVISLGAVGGLYEHSGYDFAVPLKQSRFFALWPKAASCIAGGITSRAHAEHHRQNNVSFSDGFGSPGICDTLFGTRWDQAGASARSRETSAQSTF